MYKNVMEIALEEKLDELWKNYDCCKCQKCHDDVMAYALNNIKTKYVASVAGELYSKLDSLSLQYEPEMIAVLTKAIMEVQNNPRHED